MRRFLIILLVFVMGIGFAIPMRSQAGTAVTIEPENSFCIYGLPGMDIEVRFSRSLVFSHTFGDDASFYANPLVIDVQSLLNEDATLITITSTTAFGIAIGTYNHNPIAVRTGDVQYLEFSRTFNTTTELAVTLLNWQRCYMLPYNYIPDYPGVTPTPFVNDGEEIVVGDTDIKSTIGAVDDFHPFIQFIFSTVIPWASVAGVVILVFATIKFMLKG